MTQKAQKNNIRITVISLAHIHFFLAFAYIATTIAHQAWKLATPEALLQRWMVTVAALTAITVVWFLSRSGFQSSSSYRWLLCVLIAIDVAIAGFSVYTQRGFASRAVALFAIPIAVSSVLGSCFALFSTATLAAVTYALAAIMYFSHHPSEGYKVELYSDIAFYCVSFFILATVLWASFVRQKTKSR